MTISILILSCPSSLACVPLFAAYLPVPNPSPPPHAPTINFRYLISNVSHATMSSFGLLEQMKSTTTVLHKLPIRSHDHIEELTVEMLDQLQSQQISLEQYCTSIITSTASMLPGYLNKHLSWTTLQGDELPVVGGVCADIAVSIQLLAAAMELMMTKKTMIGGSDPLTDVR